MRSSIARLLPVVLLFLTAQIGSAAVWPEQWWEYQRSSLTPLAVDPAEGPVWEEYGLQEAEVAEYSDSQASFRASLWRVKDATSALGVFQWKKPAGWRTSDIAELAVTNGRDTYYAYGNYLFLLEGHLPEEDVRNVLYLQLPRLELTSLPVLPTYLPRQGFISGSERYIIGPAGLDEFEGRISPSLAAFQFGTEGQLGRYTGPGGEMSLVILNYPTAQIARKVLEQFQATEGILAKRTGPFVVAVVQPPDPDAAQRLLARVDYQATISWNEPIAGEGEAEAADVGEFLIGVFKLIGFLLVGTLAFGAVFAGIRLFGQRYLGWSPTGARMVTLDIDRESQR